MKRNTARILCLASLGGLAGCGVSNTMYKNDIIATIDGIVDNEYSTVVERRLELEEELASLEKKRVDAVAAMKERIAASKASIASDVEALDLSSALATLNELDTYLHAPGEEPPKTSTQKLARYAELTDVAYIASASMEIIARADDAMKAGRFQSLVPVLEPSKLPDHADPEADAVIEVKRTEFQQRWMEYLDGASKKALRAAPATAFMYALKGATLAKKLGDDAKAKALMGRVKSAKEAVARTHGYDVVLTSARGFEAAGVAKSLTVADWGARPISVKTGGAGADASLSFTLGAPSLKSSKSKTTGSFRYKSGTKTVPNPAWVKIQEDCKDRQESYARRVKSCNENPTNSAGNPTMECGLVPQNKGFMEMICRDKDRYPSTRTVDVFDEQSYPIMVYSMRATTDGSAELSPVRGEARRVSKKVEAVLTDEEHAAHSKNGSGVSADAAKPPTETGGERALANAASAWLRGVIGEGMSAHQRSYLSGSGDRVERLAVHVLLDPSKADPEARAELEEALELSGITKLVGGR